MPPLPPRLGILLVGQDECQGHTINCSEKGMCRLCEENY